MYAWFVVEHKPGWHGVQRVAKVASPFVASVRKMHVTIDVTAAMSTSGK